MIEKPLQEDFYKLRRMAIEKDFMNMNDKQKQAVFHTQGPLLVLAGAGSGKTTVIVNKIVHLIKYGNGYNSPVIPSFVQEEDLAFLNDYIANDTPTSEERERAAELCTIHPLKPYQIIAITFTNKAAGELKSRISAAIGEEAGAMIWASTFHSACVKILRRDGDRCGYGRNFTIYDSDDSQRVIKECIKEKNVDDKRFAPRMVQNQISRAKNELLVANDFVQKYAGQDFRLKVIGELYQAYEQKLKAANALDFDDIIMRTVFLLQDNPDILSYYQNRFRYVLVDEYQDTNHSQYMLVSLLAGGYRNVCVVGDDDQSIYGFRGANIDNILNFEKSFPNAAEVRLEQNYRSTKTILEAANQVIKKNRGRKAKTLWTDNLEGKGITICNAPNDQQESMFIAETIFDGVKKENRKYSDFAILYRMNAQSGQLERTFSKMGLPHKIIGGIRFYDRKEIKDMLSYLCLIANHQDDLRLRRIINAPKRGIGETTVELCTALATSLEKSIYEICGRAHEIEPLFRSAQKLRGFVDLIEGLTQKKDQMGLRDFVELVMRETGYLPELEKATDPESKGRVENLYELLSNVLAYEKSSERGTLEGFLEEVALLSDIDNHDSSADAVSLMTVHSAKGLEFPIVFIYGMEENIFPSMMSASDPQELEEERRLSYVAITRARERLYITHAEDRILYGKTVYNKLSRFVADIPPELREEATPKWTPKRQSTSSPASFSRPAAYRGSSMFAEKAQTSTGLSYSVGEMVEHKTFGRGMVLTVKKMSGDIFLEIAFDQVGTKKLMANFAKLTKI
jgi:DNA helicase-2/ATP-dependent DNA helicase PcrA